MLTRLVPSRLAAAVFLAAFLILLSGCARLTRPIALVFDEPQKTWRLETLPIAPGESKDMPESFPVFTADETGKRRLGYAASWWGPPHGLPKEVVWSQSEGWVIKLGGFAFRTRPYSGDHAEFLSPDGLYNATVERTGRHAYTINVANTSEYVDID